MDIYEALEKLDSFLDMLANQGVLSNEECDEIGECEDVIYAFAKEHAPRQEDLPLEFDCNCGEHLYRTDIYGGMSRFYCPKCEAEWLVGHSF